MVDATPPATDEAAASDAESAPDASRALLRLALELGPVALFLWASGRYDFFVGTGVFMVAIIVSLIVTRLRERRWPIMALVSGALVLVFGGLTIWLQDETLIKLKITILNAAFGLALVVGMGLGKPLIRILLGDALHLDDAGWAKLTKLWAGYFFFVAVLNEIVWRNTSDETWLKFKFGLMALSLLFALAQAPVIAKHDISGRAPGSEPGA